MERDSLGRLILRRVTVSVFSLLMSLGWIALILGFDQLGVVLLGGAVAIGVVGAGLYEHTQMLEVR
ncbi:hypothetical protein C439_04025 [Haloferax mediterranei ATCC 33500]|nr:hypothetical protein C439_04025 [Haloferax mediterranei ATCC 33500]